MWSFHQIPWNWHHILQTILLATGKKYLHKEERVCEYWSWCPLRERYQLLRLYIINTILHANTVNITEFFKYDVRCSISVMYSKKCFVGRDKIHLIISMFCKGLVFDYRVEIQWKKKKKKLCINQYQVLCISLCILD